MAETTMDIHIFSLPEIVCFKSLCLFDVINYLEINFILWLCNYIYIHVETLSSTFYVRKLFFHRLYTISLNKNVQASIAGSV
jgi:hypothetical protein